METSQNISTISDPLQESTDDINVKSSTQAPPSKDQEDSSYQNDSETNFDIEEVNKRRITVMNHAKKQRNESGINVQTLVQSSVLKNKSLINMQEFQEMDNVGKIEALKNYVPKIQGDLKFFPLDQIDALKEHSMSYYHYFKLYKLSIGLLFIQLALTFSATTFLYYVIGIVPQMTVFWVEFGLVLGLGIPLIGFLRYKQEKKLLDNTSLLEEQSWTEDKFTLVIENFDVKSTKEEIREFLDGILTKTNCEGRVLKIFKLQECSQLARLDKEFKEASELLGKQKKKIINKDLEKKLKNYQEFLTQIERFERYRGKTIVIFETMAAKRIIHNYFRINPIKRFYYSICCNCCKLGIRYKLHQKIPYTSNAPEPADFIYENAHYSKNKRRLNELFTYAFGGSFIAGLFVAIIVLKILADNEEDNEFMHYLVGAVCPILNIIVGITGGILVNNFLIRRRKSSYHLEQIILRVRFIFINTVVFFSVLMTSIEQKDNFEEIIVGNVISILAIIPVVKLLYYLVDRIQLRRKYSRIINSKDLSKYSQQEIINTLGKPQVKISLYVGSLANYIFISTSFYFVGGWIICFLGLVGLIINLFFDKYMMIHHLAPINTKNSEMGLHFYEIMRYEVPLQLLPLASLGPLLTGGPITGITPMLYIAFGLAMVYPRKPISSLWKDAWTNKRLNVKYEDVKSQFPHTYDKEYLFEIY